MSIKTLGKRLNSIEDSLVEPLETEMMGHMERIFPNDRASIQRFFDAWGTSLSDRTPEQLELIQKVWTDTEAMSTIRQIGLVDWSYILRTP